MDPALAIAMLQLLYSIYTERRRRSETRVPDPARIREIIDDVQAEGSTAIEAGEIERRIEAKFDAVEAKLIKDDLALFNLLLNRLNLIVLTIGAFSADMCRRSR